MHELITATLLILILLSILQALLTAAQRQNCITYFIGVHVDKARMRGEQLNAEIPFRNFQAWDLSKFHPLVPGMDVLVSNFKVKELPLLCSENLYEGGKKEAMARRRELLDNDPTRRERKRLKRLEELRAKMEKSKKRKRDQEEMEALEKQVKQEEETNLSEEHPEEENDETNLLESALDTMNEGKTREEAEADRAKLLAGELLDEGATGDESDEEEQAMYTGDGARQGYAMPKSTSANVTEEMEEPPARRTRRFLPVSEERAEVLRQLGYPLVSDEECTKIGSAVPSNDSASSEDKQPTKVHFKFIDKFDIVELDANGYVIDKGDEDFQPSKSWVGRKAGFEFKLGARGLGYYRTGKKVVVPSNTAY